MSERVYELAILGRITWNLHSLNNEGSLGNVTEPRTVMLADGTKCDAVSGEMLKHVHVQALWQIASNDLPLCSNCKILEPSRANNADELKNTGPATEAMKKAIESCAICDLHGFLVEKPTINRASCLEFGWAVGIPNHWYRDLHLHARHAVGERAKPKAQQTDNSEETSDEPAADARSSQMVYNRPTRSGVYAIVTLFAPWRIGLSHLTYDYLIDEDARIQRYRLAMKAYQAMFWRTDGAMTTTRLPHVEAFEGAVVISKSNLPVPTVSPLADDYQQQLKLLVQAIDKSAVEVQEFTDMAGFVSTLSDLAKNYLPYHLHNTHSEPSTLQKEE